MLIPDEYRERYDNLAASRPWMREMLDEEKPGGALDDRRAFQLSFADRLRAMRENRGMSKRETRELAGVSEGVYSRYEGAKSEPTAYVVVKLARALGTSADVLLGLEEWE